MFINCNIFREIILNALTLFNIVNKLLLTNNYDGDSSMRCPNCNSENNEGAKFCKKCGTPLENKSINHEKIISSMSNENSGNNTTKYIIVALIIVAVVLAGAFIYLYGFNNDNSQANQEQIQNDNQSSVDNSEPVQATQSSQSAQPQTSAMSILGGSFSTGGGLEDKTYASIFVGSEHAGENVKIQIFYSRDGSTLNNGNMVPKTVDSSGYIEVASADAYKYFPDYAEINLYDNSGNLLDTQSVSLNPESGTQTF